MSGTQVRQSIVRSSVLPTEHQQTQVKQELTSIAAGGAGFGEEGGFGAGGEYGDGSGAGEDSGAGGFGINIHSTASTTGVHQEINQGTTIRPSIVRSSVLPTINAGVKVLKTILGDTKTLQVSGEENAQFGAGEGTGFGLGTGIGEEAGAEFGLGAGAGGFTATTTTNQYSTGAPVDLGTTVGATIDLGVTGSASYDMGAEGAGAGDGTSYQFSAGGVAGFGGDGFGREAGFGGATTTTTTTTTTSSYGFGGAGTEFGGEGAGAEFAAGGEGAGAGEGGEFAFGAGASASASFGGMTSTLESQMGETKVLPTIVNSTVRPVEYEKPYIGPAA